MTISGNPNFEFVPSVQALRDSLGVAGREHEWLFTHAAERDRDLEDYLNKKVVRRVITSGPVYGTGTLHQSTTWVDIAPSVGVFYWKASKDSVLVATVSGWGEIGGAAAGRYISFGVRLTDILGTQVTTEACRAPADASYAYVPHNGSVGLTAAAGLYIVDLRIKMSNAATTWTSQAAGSLSLTVVESST